MRKIVKLIDITERYQHAPGLWTIRPLYLFDDGSNESFFLKLTGPKLHAHDVIDAANAFMENHNSRGTPPPLDPPPIAIPQKYVPLPKYKLWWARFKLFFRRWRK
jgi:hypothetical protein